MREKIKKCNSLQNKFLILFIFISIIPITVSIWYMSRITLKLMNENIEQSAITQLKNIDTTVYEKANNIQASLNNIYMNSDIRNILVTDNGDYDLFTSQIKRYIMDTDDIFGLAFVTPSNNTYTYNVSLSSTDVLRMKIIYKQIDEKPNKLTWFGQIPSDINPPRDNMVMAVSAYNNPDEKGGYKKIANVYIYVKNNIFNEIFNSESKGSIFVFDQSGKVVTETDQDKYFDILNSDMNIMDTLFSENSSGVAKTNKSMSVIYYNSRITNFKYAKVCGTDVLYKEIYQVRIYAAVVILLMFLVATGAYMIIMKKITKPITLVAEHMESMSWENIDKKIEFSGSGEVASIVNGYNKMSDKIFEMVEEIKIKEQKKKESDINAMNYQINPHFLHNTLAMLRIMAMKHNDTEVSAAIFDLNVILKNVFRSSSGYISVSYEVKMLKSFIRLLNFRYEGKIDFKIRADEAANDMMIPTMMIQPLVENAVMHGLTPKMENPEFLPKVEICIETDGENLVIMINDNGIGMKEKTAKETMTVADKKSSGIGMANVDGRIKLIYGNDYGISIMSHEGLFTRITILIPNVE